MRLLFLFQETKNILNTKNPKPGQEIARWLYEHPAVFLGIGVLISVGFVWIVTKIAKQIRTFGE
ncbi:hypothetical protein [Tenacibaculum piscium]|uniref:hypothetical protein n=1 Tax=Tenacibaculum piscium TaxID=1458515 RepID=UPI001F3821EC|nr:hypothetical protein [Tenacibaculum piscium]